MKIAIKTADRGGFLVATYIMNAEFLPVLLSINIRGNETLKNKSCFFKYDFSEIGLHSIPEKTFLDMVGQVEISFIS